MRAGSFILNMSQYAAINHSGKSVTTARNMIMCHVMVVSLDSANLKHSFCHLNRVSLAKSVVIFFQGTYLLLHQVFIGNMLTNDTRMYLLSCNGLCKNINVAIALGSGDLHAFSKDDIPFKIKVIIK